jgi:hypothetical protein
LAAKGPIRNAKGDIAWALGKLQDFRYRERFGLSYEDFLREPFDEFLVNLEIMSAESKLERALAKKTSK